MLTGLANCPLGMVLTYKNLMYSLNLQFSYDLYRGYTEWDIFCFMQRCLSTIDN